MYEFHVTPKSEKELSDLVADGEYQFEVVKSTGREKNGYPQMVWNLKFWDKSGKDHYISCFFKFDSESNFCMRMIRHALFSVGCSDLWEKGKWNAPDFDGKTGVLSLGMQEAGYGKDGKFYAAKNVVKDFISDRSDLQTAVNSLPSRNVNSDLPPVEAYKDIPGFD